MLVKVEVQLVVGLASSDAQSKVGLEFFDVVGQMYVSRDAKDAQIRDRESTWLRSAYHIKIP